MTGYVLLINPLLPRPMEALNIPMGLMCLGSYLAEQGYEVIILDANNADSSIAFAAQLQRRLPGALFAGLTVMSAQLPHALELSRLIHSSQPGLPVVWGGIHPTLYPLRTAASPAVDFVVSGEGEASLLELTAALAAKTDYTGIAGLTFQVPQTGQVIQTSPGAHLDPNSLPAINWRLLEDIRKIGSLRQVEKLTLTGLPLQTSRGCPHRCAFCINSVCKEGLRLRSAELVVRELQGLHRQGVRRINFLDEIFFFNKKRLLAILDGIEQHRLDFSWYASVRCDYFRPGFLDEPLLKRLKQCGCTVVGIGAESGSQRILDYLKKDISPDNILQAAHLLSQNGIRANFSFIIGLPGEKIRDMQQTLELIRKITAIDSHFKILGPQLYRPYPGSELYNDCLQAGMQEPRTLEEWAGSLYIHSGEKKGDPAFYPWLNLPLPRLQNLIFYASLLGRNSRFNLLTKITRHIVAFRCRHFFFALPWEKWLYQFLHKLGLNRLIRSRFRQ